MSIFVSPEIIIVSYLFIVVRRLSMEAMKSDKLEKEGERYSPISAILLFKTRRRLSVSNRLVLVIDTSYLFLT